MAVGKTAFRKQFSKNESEVLYKKKLISIVLAALMLCSMLSLAAAAKNVPLWSDYFTSAEVLDLDKLMVKGHTEKDGSFVCDEWNLPQKIQFTKKDGSKIDVTVDTSGMTSVKDDAIFTLEAAKGVELTFAEFMIISDRSNCIYLGISQKIGDGDDVEYKEVTTIEIDYDFGNSSVNDKRALSLWDRIVIFFKDLIQKIEIFFLDFTSGF